LREANFTEVEVGLQSIEPDAMARMDRKNNLRAFERGVRAMLREGIRVKVDLIVGLPGDTPESVRKGLRYLHEGGLYSDIQVFHLAVLPGTAFREEAGALGLKFQSRPPYHVLRSPALTAAGIGELIEEAEDIFGVEFDAPLPPVLAQPADLDPARLWNVDLDAGAGSPPSRRAQAFTLWLRSEDFSAHRATASGLVRELLRENPFTTLQIALEPCKSHDAAALIRSITPALLEALLQTCLEQPTYLDKCHALSGRPAGAKRLVVLLPFGLRAQLPEEWLEGVSEAASIVWLDGEETALQANEFTWAECV
jgi:hypothetical protein